MDKFECRYIDSFKKQTKYLKESYDTYLNETDLEWWKFDKNSMQITISIINRLKAYYTHGDGIKSLLDKNKLTPASDFFVEQILFFVKLYLNKVNPCLIVCSERGYQINNGVINKTFFPDISIWNNDDELVSIIECKTQLGRNRKDWADKFKERRDIFAKKNQNIKWFYCVMTGQNWKGHGFKETLGEDYNKLDNNVSYYCLLDEETHPREYESHAQIDNRIEDLLLELNKLKKSKGRDDRLVELYKFFTTDKEKREKKDIKLKTTYKGKEFIVRIDKWGRIKFKGDWYATPNLLYNKGVKLFVNPKLKGSSGKNSLSQFSYKGVRLNDDESTWRELKSKMGIE